MISPIGRTIAALSAALLLGGCLAGDIPYPRLEAKYAYPDTRFVEVDGVRVHYRDQGPRDARTLVLVHGFAASLHAWEPWAQRLSGDYRVITLDLPAHGLTRTPAGYQVTGDRQVAVVDGLVRHLGVERFVIGGNSMGGGVAWRYALAHPGKVEGLVLVAAAGWPVAGQRREGPPLVFRLLANPVGRALLRNVDPRLMAEGGLKQAYLDERMVTSVVVDRYVELARAPGRREMLTQPRRNDGEAVTPDTFRRITAPTLVMVGAQDSVIPAAQAAGFAQAIPNARLVTYADGGHVPMEQLPDRSASDLRAFLQELPPR